MSGDDEGGDRGGGGGERDADEDERHPIPIDGEVLLYAGTTASVAPERIGPLLREAQAHVDSRLAAYRRSHERAFEDDERAVFLTPEGHWREVGEELGLPEREVDALRRAHAEQLERIGAETGRREEWETALEIREAVVVGKP